MDRFYQGVEASLLALGFALGLSVALLSNFPTQQSDTGILAVTLPEISVSPAD